MKKRVKYSVLVCVILSFIAVISACKSKNVTDTKVSFLPETRREERQSETAGKIARKSKDGKKAESSERTKPKAKTETNREKAENKEENKSPAETETKPKAGTKPSLEFSATTSPEKTTEPPMPTTDSSVPATLRVTLSVDCSAAVNAGNETAQLISDNGIVLAATAYELNQGSTVYDLIMNSGLTVGARGGYIYSIQSLGEFDVNGKGGWYYFVNGYKPSYGVAEYILQPGDQVFFQYTLDY